MGRESSRPESGVSHADIAAKLFAAGDPDYRILQEGHWPDRERVLGAIDRLHRLLMAETLPDTRPGESATPCWSGRVMFLAGGRWRSSMTRTR